MKPKYLRVCSDLHLEQWTGQREEFLAERFVPPDDRDVDSAIALAGDISSRPEQLLNFIRELEKRFQRIYYVPGNHETYKHDINEWCANLSATLTGDITKFATDAVGYEELDGVRFIFTTLWADGGKSEQEQFEVEDGLNDFRLIRNGDRRFTVHDMIALHKKQKAKLVEHLKTPFDGKTVVITHHLPSYRLCHPRFGTSLNGGFASNCEDILAYDHAPQLWVHGHTHDHIDTFLWKTRIVCNPSGYYSERASPFNKYGPTFIELDRLGEEES